MDGEDLDRAFYFIVTGQYTAVRHDGNDFVLHSDTHHIRGSLFYLSDDEEKIIYNCAYVGHLTSHPDYRDDVFYICRELQYLSRVGLWTDNIVDALHVQLDPELDPDADVPPDQPLFNPIVSASNPISADGIDLYHPDKWFALYPIIGDCLWSGNADEFESKLFFGGKAYSVGIPFRLSKNEGKIQIRSMNGKFLTVMPPDNFGYLGKECRQHNALSRCLRCMHSYSVGFHSKPQDCFTLIPRGLPSMFVLHDGAYYYRINVLKSSYADLLRVEQIEEASLFQFVG